MLSESTESRLVSDQIIVEGVLRDDQTIPALRDLGGGEPEIAE